MAGVIPGATPTGPGQALEPITGIIFDNNSGHSGIMADPLDRHRSGQGEENAKGQEV